MVINFSLLLIPFFLLNLIPLWGLLAPVACNKNDADVIPEMDISPCLFLLSSSFCFFSLFFVLVWGFFRQA